MGLRWPLSSGSQFKLYFYWDDGETEDRAKVFTSPLFEGLLIKNTKIMGHFNENKVHGNTNMT